MLFMTEWVSDCVIQDRAGTGKRAVEAFWPRSLGKQHLDTGTWHPIGVQNDEVPSMADPLCINMPVGEMSDPVLQQDGSAVVILCAVQRHAKPLSHAP